MRSCLTSLRRESWFLNLNFALSTRSYPGWWWLLYWPVSISSILCQPHWLSGESVLSSFRKPEFSNWQSNQDSLLYDVFQFFFAVLCLQSLQCYLHLLSRSLAFWGLLWWFKSCSLGSYSSKVVPDVHRGHYVSARWILKLFAGFHPVFH